MSTPDAAFYFDLASPLAYLAAERVLHTMPVATEWQPVLARELPGSDSISKTRRADIQRRAAELDLQQLRWPDPFPFDSDLAMRAATYAKSIGRIVAFAQAAFRQAFAGGRPLDVAENVLIAAAACEMHPSAVLKGAALRWVGEQLSAATTAATALGVEDVPAVRVGERVFHGERALEDAAAYARVIGRLTRDRGAPDASAVAAAHARIGGLSARVLDTADTTTVTSDVATDTAGRHTP